MNEYEASAYGGSSGVNWDFDHDPVDDEPARPSYYKPPPQEAVDLRAVRVKASEFFFGLLNKSRTERAARLRVAAARYVISRSEKPNAICKRLGVKRRRFFQVCAEIREECGLPPATRKKKKSRKRT